MNILYICNLAKIGGIETQMLRIAQNSESNVSVLPLGRSFDEDLKKEFLQTKVNIFDVTSFGKVLFSGMPKNVIISRDSAFRANHFDIIFTFDDWTYFAGLYIKQKYYPSTKIIQGIYHPRLYNWKPRFFNFTWLIFRHFFKIIPGENLIFMNKESLDGHTAINPNTDKATIIPMAVDFERFAKINRIPKKDKIISVGRIVDFKPYNFTLLPVLRELIDQGYDLEYHIYGHGNLEKVLINEIEKNGLVNNVFFHGALKYSELENVYQDAYIFIGVGTAIVEACAAGIPSILAVDSNKYPTTYGWFHEMPGFSMGEIITDLPLKPFYDVIKEICDNPGLYEEYAIKAKQKAQTFALKNILVMFPKVFENAQWFSVKLLYLKIYGIIIILEHIIFTKMLHINPNKNKYLLVNKDK